MGSSNETQYAPLLDLPQELIQWIAEFLVLSSPALLNLRSTCRVLKAATERVVAESYFSEGSFLIYNEASMQTLRAISSHAVYAKSMNRICFSLAQIPTLLGRHYRGSNVAMQRQQTELRRNSRPLRHAQKRFARQQGTLEYLKDILSNFKRSGNTPELIVRDEADWIGLELQRSHMTAWGYKRICREIGLEDCLEVEFDQGFDDICEAICDTEYPVSSLELGCEDHGVRLGIFLLQSRHNNSYANLRTLRLTITLNHRSEDEEEDDDDDDDEHEEYLQVLAESFSSFLVDARNLESLYMSSEEDTPQRVLYIIFESIVQAATGSVKPESRGLRNLRVLELEGLGFDTTRLLEFVQATRGNLERLSIRDSNKDLPPGIQARIRDAYGGTALELDIE